jgi:hypothetical protein
VLWAVALWFEALFWLLALFGLFAWKSLPLLRNTSLPVLNLLLSMTFLMKFVLCLCCANSWNNCWLFANCTFCELIHSSSRWSKAWGDQSIFSYITKLIPFLCWAIYIWWKIIRNIFNSWESKPRFLKRLKPLSWKFSFIIIKIPHHFACAERQWYCHFHLQDLRYSNLGVVYQQAYTTRHLLFQFLKLNHKYYIQLFAFHLLKFFHEKSVWWFYLYQFLIFQ